MLKKFIKKFGHAIEGIGYVSLNDFGFRFQLYLGALVAFFVLAFLLPLTSTDFLFIMLAYLLILITELQNSALESALDKIHPQIDDHIKHSKDMTAGAVLIAGLFLLLVLIVICCGRFFNF